jgi:hypothetical protein
VIALTRVPLTAYSVGKFELPSRVRLVFYFMAAQCLQFSCLSRPSVYPYPVSSFIALPVSEFRTPHCILYTPHSASSSCIAAFTSQELASRFGDLVIFVGLGKIGKLASLCLLPLSDVLAPALRLQLQLSDFWPFWSFRLSACSSSSLESSIHPITQHHSPSATLHIVSIC